MALDEEREATALVNAWLYVALADGELDELEQEVLERRIAQLYPTLPSGVFPRMFGKAIVTVATSSRDEILALVVPDNTDEADRLLENLRLLAKRKGGLDINEDLRLAELTQACPL